MDAEQMQMLSVVASAPPTCGMCGTPMVVCEMDPPTAATNVPFLLRFTCPKGDGGSAGAEIKWDGGADAWIVDWHFNP